MEPKWHTESSHADEKHVCVQGAGMLGGEDEKHPPSAHVTGQGYSSDEE